MEKQFKLDIHVHTSETSSCGQVSAQEAVRLYEQAGSDFHHPSHLATGGIILNGNFDTIQEIAEAVRNNEIRELIHSDEN